jgi:hypothetical protein
MDDSFHVPLVGGVMASVEHACDAVIRSALLPII